LGDSSNTTWRVIAITVGEDGAVKDWVILVTVVVVFILFFAAVVWFAQMMVEVLTKAKHIQVLP
jgi:hypothetical protein